MFSYLKTNFWVKTFLYCVKENIFVIITTCPTWNFEILLGRCHRRFRISYLNLQNYPRVHICGNAILNISLEHPQSNFQTRTNHYLVLLIPGKEREREIWKDNNFASHLNGSVFSFSRFYCSLIFNFQVLENKRCSIF